MWLPRVQRMLIERMDELIWWCCRQAQQNWSCAQTICKQHLGFQAKLLLWIITEGLRALYSLHSFCSWDPAASFL